MIDNKEIKTIKKLKFCYFNKYFLIMLSLVVISWFVFVGFLTYDFFSPKAWDLIIPETQYYFDIFTKLPHNLDDFAFLSLFLFSAIGPGVLFLRFLRIDWKDEIEKTFFGLAVGLILFTFLTLALGTLGLLQKRIFLGWLGLSFLLSLSYFYSQFYEAQKKGFRIKSLFQKRKVTGRQVLIISLILAIVFHLYLNLLGALGPEIHYDAHHYHLGPPKHYAQKERIYDILNEDGMVAAVLNPYQQTLYTAIIKMYSVISAKALHWGQALIVVLFLIYFCKIHLDSLIGGLVAGLIFINIPLVSWSTGTGGNDLPLALYTILGVHTFLRWCEQPQKRIWLILLGGFLGYSFGVKMFGFAAIAVTIIGIIIFDFWYYRAKENFHQRFWRSFRNLCLFGVPVLLVCLPWLGRSYILSGNPFFPYLDTIFNSPFWTAKGDETAKQSYISRGVDTSLLGLLIYPLTAVTESSKLRGLLGPIFLIWLPLGVLVGVFGRTKRVILFRFLAIAVALWAFFWFLTGAIENRYTQSVLPVMAVLVAYLLVVPKWEGWSGKALKCSLGVITGFVIIFNSPLFVFVQNPNNWVYANRASIPWTLHYRDTKESDILLPYLPMIRFINQNLNAVNDKVYDGTSLMVTYLYSDIQMFNGSIWESPTSLGIWSLAKPDALERLKAKKVTYVTLWVKDIPQYQEYRIWRNLQEIYRTQETEPQALFKVNYEVEQSPIEDTYISVTPNPVPLDPISGNGTTTIRWNVKEGEVGQVYVSANGASEQLFRQGIKGSANAPWISTNATYVFRLYAGTEHKVLLAEQVVKAANPPEKLLGDRYILVDPSPVPINPNSRTGIVTVYWDTKSGQAGQLYVSVDNGLEQLFAEDVKGVSTISWIGASRTYVFKLYSGKNKEFLLGSFTVTTK
jgi:hypothetical protein